MKISLISFLNIFEIVHCEIVLGEIGEIDGEDGDDGRTVKKSVKCQ